MDTRSRKRPSRDLSPPPAAKHRRAPPAPPLAKATASKRNKGTASAAPAGGRPERGASLKKGHKEKGGHRKADASRGGVSEPPGCGDPPALCPGDAPGEGAAAKGNTAAVVPMAGGRAGRSSRGTGGDAHMLDGGDVEAMIEDALRHGDGDEDDEHPADEDDEDDLFDEDALAAVAAEAVGGGLEGAAGGLAQRMAEAARARGLGPGAASSAMQALLTKLAGRAGGPSLEDILPGMGGPGGSITGTSARLKGILAGLRCVDDTSAQMDALNQLCELISMSHEETLARCFSLESFVPLLVGLLDAEHNPDAMLLAARALTHLADVFPPARASIVRANALPTLCSRLLNIEYIDLAEQSLQALSKLAHDHGPAVARAGGLAACLAYLDFFSIGLQRVAVATAAAMCRNLQPNCHALALESAPQLSRLLTSEDGKLVEHAATALSRCAASMSGEPLHQLCTPELLSQALTLLTPPQPGSGATSGQPAVSGPTIGALVVLLQTAVQGCPEASKQLLLTGGVGVLAAALRAGGGGVHAVSSPGPGGHIAAPVSGGSIQAWADHVADVVSLVTALLPVVPAPDLPTPLPGPPGDEVDAVPGGRAASRSRRSSRHTAGEAGDGAGPSGVRYSYADILARDCPELIDAMATELVPVLIPLASGGPTGTPRDAATPLTAAARLPGMGAGTSVRHRALGATHRLVHFASPGGLGGILAVPQSTASFVACLLQSSDSTVLMPALQITDTLLTKAAAVMGRAMVKEGALHALGVIAATQAPNPAAPPSGPSPQVIAYAATLRQRHAAALGLSSDVQAGGAGDDLARLTGLCAALAAADEPSTAGSPAAEKRGEEALRELLDALGSADGGVSTFEFLESGVAAALLAYLTASARPQHSRQAAGSARLRALLRNGAAAHVGARSLVRKLLDALASTERLPVTSLTADRVGSVSDSGAGIAATSLAALGRPFKLCLKKDAGDKGLRDYSTNVVLVEPLASLSAVEDFLLPRVHIRRTPSALEEAVPGQAGGPADGKAAPDAEPGSRATRAGGSPQTGAAPVVPPAEAAGGVPAVTPAAPPTDSHLVDMDEDEPVSDDDDGDGDDDDGGDEDDEGLMFGGGDDDMVDDEEDGGAGDGQPDREMVHTVDVVNPSQLAEGGASAAPPTQAGNRAATAAAAASQPPSAATPSAPASFAEAAARGAADAGAGTDAGATGNAHLVFSVSGIRGGLKTTIMQAVYAACVARAAGTAGPSTGEPGPRGAANRGEAGGLSMWDEVHTITYRLATPDDAEPPEHLPGSGLDAAGAVQADNGDGVPLTHTAATAAVAAAHGDAAGAALDAVWARASRALPATVTAALGSGPASDSVALLRLLYLSGLTLPEEFISPQLGAKLARQLCDAVALSSGALPGWTTALPACASFLFAFDVRRQLFFATALGVPRALHRLQTSGLPPGGPNSPGNEAAGGGGGGPFHGGGGSARVARLQRQKVRISRTRMLDSATKVFTLAGTSTSVLEVEFFGEEGTGTGPTLEFYTLLSREFTSKKVNLWRDVDEPITKHSDFHEAAAAGGSAHEDITTSSVTAGPPPDEDQLCTRHGLFPSPLTPDASAAEVTRVCDLFALLGRAAAKAIQDGRLLDVPLSGAFYKAMQGKTLTPEDVASFDPRLGATLSELAALAHVADTLLGDQDAAALDRLQLRGVAIQELCITFTVPGQPGYQLCPGGADLTVTGANLSAYVAALTDALVGSGVFRQMAAFRTGFGEVCAPGSLRLFSPTELEALLCGAGERWTPDLLAECLRFDHGYTVSSPPVQALISVLCDLSTAQQQAFLRFVTGAPRLPPGGLAKLHPRLTIVCKHPSGGAAAAALGTSAGRARLALGTTAADGDLPSAMTCANYLKLPPYSSRMALKERLLYAVYEGSGSFLLS